MKLFDGVLGLGVFAAAILAGSCGSPEGTNVGGVLSGAQGGPRALRASLDRSSPGFGDLRDAFEGANAGYGLGWNHRLATLGESSETQVVFVQAGVGRARVLPDPGPVSDVRVGDIVVLRPGERLACDPPVAALVFQVPARPPASVPSFVRPDFDPRITDSPGGCAEEDDAYRRILLTWQGNVGPYLFRAINAHRVRILDSFTHYHPAEGGFDEFYLVQEAPVGAELIVSENLEAIQAIAAVTRNDVPGLLRRIPLRAGDLIYLPRTVVHRGVGGAVVQVITVPGFVPGAEISVDAELSEINQRLDLSGGDALPVHR